MNVKVAAYTIDPPPNEGLEPVVWSIEAWHLVRDGWRVDVRRNRHEYAEGIKPSELAATIGSTQTYGKSPKRIANTLLKRAGVPSK